MVLGVVGFFKAGFLCVLTGASGTQVVKIKPEVKAIALIIASLFLPYLTGCDDLHELGDHIAQHSLRKRTHLAVNDLAT